MWVASSHRRRGIARQLLEEVKAWATSGGVTTLSLGVREGNEQALTAYLSMGMRLSGETMPEVDQPTNVIFVMECDLGPARNGVAPNTGVGPGAEPAQPRRAPHGTIGPNCAPAGVAYAW